MARRHGLDRLVLFGSRARGTHEARSDVDIAVSGGDFDGFYWDVHDNAHTLLMFDIVDMDGTVSEDLRAEIARDGVMIYEKLDNFLACLEVLQRADFEQAINDEIYRTGVVGQFNLTFELAWKALQAVLRQHGAAVETGSPREVLQIGYKMGFIDDSAAYLAMLKTRNTAVHVYDEDEINKVILLIRDTFMVALLKLAATLEQKVIPSE